MGQVTRMSYKNTLPYATPMLTQEQKHAHVQWTIQHKDDHCSRTRFTDPFIDGHEIQVL